MSRNSPRTLVRSGASTASPRDQLVRSLVPAPTLQPQHVASSQDCGGTGAAGWKLQVRIVWYVAFRVSHPCFSAHPGKGCSNSGKYPSWHEHAGEKGPIQTAFHPLYVRSWGKINKQINLTVGKSRSRGFCTRIGDASCLINICL